MTYYCYNCSKQVWDHTTEDVILCDDCYKDKSTINQEAKKMTGDYAIPNEYPITSKDNPLTFVCDDNNGWPILFD